MESERYVKDVMNGERRVGRGRSTVRAIGSVPGSYGVCIAAPAKANLFHRVFVTGLLYGPYVRLLCVYAMSVTRVSVSLLDNDRTHHSRTAICTVHEHEHDRPRLDAPCQPRALSEHLAFSHVLPQVR